MPWNNGGPSGGSGGGPSPWGSAGGNDRPNQPNSGNNESGNANHGGPQSGGPQSGGPNRNRPPNGPQDFDQIIDQAQAFIRNLLGGGRGPRGPRGPNGPNGGGSFGGFLGSARGLSLLGLAVAALWIATGIYRVQPDEQGVVLRFGAYLDKTKPGLHWHIPWPVEEVLKPAVTRINRTEIGFRSGSGRLMETGRDAGGRDVLAESLMLTGDENIIDIDVAIFWRIRIGDENSVSRFLFNASQPEALVRGVAESSMREVIGRTPIQPALTQLRAQIETEVLRQTQQILDRYDVGVEITQVQLQKVDPPAAVIESFRDVQRANTDADRMRNEAQSYHNDIVPRARGEASRILAEALGVKLASIAQATGQAQRFESVLTAYQAAKEVTLRRMYIDTMTDVLSHAQTLVVDDRLRGLVPFLPLNLPPATTAPPTPTPPTTPTGAGATK
jgi:modulator of FtsH protease HflK